MDCEISGSASRKCWVKKPESRASARLASLADIAITPRNLSASHPAGGSFPADAHRQMRGSTAFGCPYHMSRGHASNTLEMVAGMNRARGPEGGPCNADS